MENARKAARSTLKSGKAYISWGLVIQKSFQIVRKEGVLFKQDRIARFSALFYNEAMPNLPQLL